MSNFITISTNSIIDQLKQQLDIDPLSAQNDASQNSELAKCFVDATTTNAPNVDKANNVLKIIQASSPDKIRPPHPPIKFPVFQGGGAKGGAYIGAYEALDENGYLDEVTCPGGSSAGGITAFLMALGFDSQQFRVISESMNFLDFTDAKKDGWTAYLSGNKIGTALDLAQYGAAFTGESFHKWASFYVEQILGDKNATFRDLHQKLASDPLLKDLLLTGTHYGTKDSSHAQQIFSFETTPDVVLADAVRATMSFPGAFAPWPVRERKRDEFKIIGFFADGGVLNNFPVTSFNSHHYADENYRSLERHDQNDNPVQVNPCVVGFSLTTLDKLDNEITPMTPRIKALQDEIPKAKAVTTQVKQGWHFTDLAKAVIWNTVGKPEVENVGDKQKIYNDKTVQIWPENVGTLEFEVSKEKLARIIENGKDATLLWLNKFHNSSQVYPHKKTFDARLSVKEVKLLRKHPRDFYIRQLTQLYLNFMQEIAKQQKQNKIQNKDLYENVRIRFLADQILTIDTQAKEKGIEVNKIAFHAACEFKAKQQLLKEENRAKRWKLILPEQTIENFCQIITTHPKVALRILKAQLSNIIELVQKDQGRLLKALVKADDEKLADKALNIVMTALNQCYYQGRLENPTTYFAEILNATEPSLLKLSIERHNINMVRTLFKYGADPLTQNSLYDAIMHSDYAMFRLICEHIDENLMSLDELEDQDNLLHNIFTHASNDFIVELCDDTELLSRLTQYCTDKNIFHYLAQKGTAKAFCDFAFEALVNDPSQLTVKDATGKTPLAYLIENTRLDVFNALIENGKGKNHGYFTSSDYHLDQIFQWPDPAKTKNAKLTDLKLAHCKNPEIYKIIMNHTSTIDKAMRVHQKILQSTRVESQLNIKQEPVIFSKGIKKQTAMAANEIESLSKRLGILSFY